MPHVVLLLAEMAGERVHLLPAGERGAQRFRLRDGWKSVRQVSGCDLRAVTVSNAAMLAKFNRMGGKLVP
jgi:hypothetical protein